MEFNFSEISRKCMIEKFEFINGLSELVSKYIGNIENVKYDVFHSTRYDSKNEFVVVTYKGGAIQARNCTGTSIAGIMEDFSKMIFSSQVFGDTSYYKECRNNNNLVLLDISKI